MSSRSVDVRIARLAPAASELGLLQRGRGEGFLEALAMPRARARELVWHCIVNDPRWDLQVESRSTYYASLAVEVELDPSKLCPSRLPAAADDLDHRLVVKVLADLYALGVARAGEVLLDHVANGDECDDAIHAISQGEALLRQLPEILETRFDEAGRVDIVRRWRREVPWSELAEEHRWITEALAQPEDVRNVVSAQLEPPPTDAPAADLLAHPWGGATPKRMIHRLTTMLRTGERDDLISALESPGTGCWIAFQALTKLDDPGGIPAADRIVRSGSPGRERAEALRYLRSLSGHHALPSVRQWGDAGDDRSVAALMILEHHAEPADLPYLAARLESSWSERDFYTVCSCVNALGRLRDHATVDLIGSIYEEAEYSYARCRAAEALVEVDRTDFSARFGRAALWDCETDIQRLALDVVPEDVDAVALAQVRKLERLG